MSANGTTEGAATGDRLLQIRHVEEVKKSLGRSTLELLGTVFEQSTGVPPGVDATRLRADHPAWMDQLHAMSYSHFLLKTDHEKDSYRVSGYALPLIGTSHAFDLLKCMEIAYAHLQRYYDENLRQPISAKQIKEALKRDDEMLLESLYYMRDIDGWWSGLSNDFPLKEGSTVVVNEQVLKYESFGELISRVYEWNYVNPKHQASVWWSQEANVEADQLPGFFTTDDLADYPAWFSHLDDIKKALIGEIDIAIRKALLALPTIGLRTLIERVMVEHVGEEGGFSAKLDRFQAKGYITPLHADTLRKVLDLGNASAHRAYVPSLEDVRTCVEVVKHLMHGLYVLHPEVQKMSQKTPEDPRKKN